MKIQCSCGTKVAFDVTPEMAHTRVEFVCPNCGLDSSDLVNELIQREFQEVAPDVNQTPPPVETAASPVAQPPPVPRGPVRVAIAKPAPESESGGTEHMKSCARHPGHLAIHNCLVCGKPICPQCMVLFGYVCSAFCRGQADLKGIKIPVYAGQRDEVNRRQWRKVGWMTGGVGALVAGFLGLWVWYAWFATVPSPDFSLRFEDSVQSGVIQLAADNQLVFVRSNLLVRCDPLTKQQIWSCCAVDEKQVADDLAERMKEIRVLRAKGDVPDWQIPSEQEMKETLEQWAMYSTELHVAGRNIWLATPQKLRRLDWDTGKVAAEIPISAKQVVSRRDEMMLVDDTDSGDTIVKHISYATGETREEKVPGLPRAPARPVPARPATTAGTGSTRGLDPGMIATQYQHMTYPARIALPATLSVARNQQEALRLMQDEEPGRETVMPLGGRFDLILTPEGPVRLQVRMLEEKYVTHQAMKDPPRKSVLNDGNLTVTRTAEVANEILNDMRRQATGGTVTEDQSRYQVTLQRPAVADVPEWRGEVVGPPALFSLKTVDVIAAGKGITVLDKRNKQLWQGTLHYPVRRRSLWMLDQGGDDNPTSGQGPCVEHGDTLYVADAGTLTAFDLMTGTVRWRMESVGVSRLFFDDKEMLYASSTTATADKLKYSLQIDVTSSDRDVLIKVDTKSGKILWTAEVSGAVAYVSGRYIYTLGRHQPPEEEGGLGIPGAGMMAPPYMRIGRINPKNGKLMWEYCQERCPLDVQFNQNTIVCLFRREVQVLKYLSL